MKTVLGFDCSSKTIGWALLGCKDNLLQIIEHGNIKPPDKDEKTIVERLELVSQSIDQLCQKLKPDYVVIEDIIQYMANRTKANTIITLAIFNRVVALQVYKTTKKLPIFLLPVSIRSKISKFLSISKIDKEQIPGLIQDFFGKTFFTIKYKQRGKNKGQPIIETYDEADAVAAAWAGMIFLKLVEINKVKF